MSSCTRRPQSSFMWYAESGEKTLEIEKLFNAWKKRDLTLFGKITVIKMLAIPKLILIAQTTAHKKIYIDQLKRLCFTFIWGKRDRIRRNTLIAPVSEGGLNMLDIKSFFLAVKAAWFKRIFLNNEDCSFIPRNISCSYKYILPPN